MLDLLNSNLSIAVHGGGDSGGGMAGAVEGFLGSVESLLTLSPADMFARVMPGLSALDNLHPLFVHFPIALLTLFFVLDVVGSLSGKADWRRAASWFLYCGAIFAGLTVAMGLIAAASVAHGGDVHEIMERHQNLGISVFSLAAMLAVWRFLAKDGISGAANVLYLIFATLLAGLLALTADLGGLMVYQYGVAVEPVAKINQASTVLHQHGGHGDSDDHDHADDVRESPSEQHDHHHDHSH